MAALNGSAQLVYYDSASNFATPSWELVPNVVSAEFSLTAEEIDVTHNSTNYYKKTLQGDWDATLTFTVRFDPSVVGDHFDLLMSYFSTRAEAWYRMVVESGATDGEDLKVWGTITNVSNPIAHSQGVDLTFTVRPKVATGANVIVTVQ